MDTIHWEVIDHTASWEDEAITERCRVPGGWLVKIRGPAEGGRGLTFVPDPNHSWN